MPWTGYRDFYITPSFFQRLARSLKSRSVPPGCKFLLVTGGTGAFLYQRLITDLPINKGDRSSAGIKIIELLNNLLRSFFRQEGISAAPDNVNLSEAHNVTEYDYSVFFLQPSNGVTSTDSLAALAAEACRASSLVFFKKGAPCYYSGFSTPTVVRAWPIADLASRAKAYESNHAGHYIIDQLAIEVIDRSKLSSWILGPDHCGDLYNLPNSAGCTRIIL